MKKGLAVALVLVLLSPALALAGSSTDAALALGAFAVFNQIISGTGVFGARPAVAAPVVYAPAPPIVYAPPPPPVVVAPPAYYAPVYRKAPRHVVVARGWCPPGHATHGCCY